MREAVRGAGPCRLDGFQRNAGIARCGAREVSGRGGHGVAYAVPVNSVVADGEAAQALFGELTATSTGSEELPDEVTLLGNYPNPFNPHTTIRYALPKAGEVRLVVYDLVGPRGGGAYRRTEIRRPPHGALRCGGPAQRTLYLPVAGGRQNDCAYHDTCEVGWGGVSPEPIRVDRSLHAPLAQDFGCFGSLPTTLQDAACVGRLPKHPCFFVPSIVGIKVDHFGGGLRSQSKYPLAFLLGLPDITLRSAPPPYCNRRKHCANALLCGAGPCRNPSAGLLVEGFLASEILYPWYNLYLFLSLGG